MGYTLEMPGDHYENVGLAEALKAIVEQQPQPGKPWVARIEHLVPGQYNVSVENDYQILGVFAVRGYDYVGLKLHDDDSNGVFEPGDSFALISIPTIMSVVFY